MAVEKVWVLNSMKTLLVNDSDISKWEIFLTSWKSGVLFSDIELKTEFWLTLNGDDDPVIASWSAVIICTRPTSTPIANQKVAVKFDMWGSKTFTNPVNWSKIYIEIDQTLITDPTLIEDNYPSTDYALWLNIGTMNMSTSYPATNSYIALYEFDGTDWTDVREIPTVDWNKVDLTNLIWDIITEWDIEAENIIANGTVTADDFILPWGWVQEQLDDITSWWVSWESLVEIHKYKAGEDISTGETTYVEKLPTYIESTLTQNVWDLSWNTRVFQLEVSKGWASTSFKIAIDKVLSPSSNFIVELHTVDGSNLPNGIVHANATATILNSAVTWSKQDLTVNWAWSFTMPAAWTKIAYVFKQTGDTVNATNYYRLYYGTKNTTTRPMWRYTGSTWTTTPLNIWSAINNGRNNGTSSFWWSTLNVTVTVTTTKPVFISTLTVQSLSGTGTMLLSTWSYTTSVSYTGGVVTLNEYFNTWVTFTLSGNLTFSNWRNTPWSSTGSLLTVSVSTGNHWYLFSTQEISSVTNSSIYISSASSYDDMLSLTDARYIYKLWSDYPRISTDNYSVWADVISMYYWLYSDYIWLTDKLTYYIANIPWAISAVPWNYKRRLGKSVNTNTIYINDEDSIIPWTTFTVASLATARNTTSITFVKAKSTQVVSDWEYTVVFSHQAGVSRTSEAQIYRNWIAYWTLYSTTSTSAVVRTENLYFNEWDTIEIRHREINWLSAWSTVSGFSVTYSLLSESNSWINNID